MTYKNLERSFPKVADAGYTSTFQAGLVLLDTIMKNLCTDKIEIIDANLEDYFALRNDFWNKKPPQSHDFLPKAYRTSFIVGDLIGSW
ncbi:MAG: hypothetical protein MRQ09_05185 [Candidatus Midichloria sp.]|nr:hypothetical protein [Candidatus Midichloria sp.]